MIQHVYSILCTKTAVDPESDQISLIDVVDRIEARPETFGDGQLYISFPCALVTKWLKSSPEGVNRGKVKMKLQLPSGKRFEDAGSYDVDLTDSPAMRITGKLTAFPFDGWGLIWFITTWQRDGETTWDEVGRFPFFVTEPCVSPVAPEKTEQEALA
jgi:hypothetical protein